MRTYRELEQHLQGGRDKTRRPLQNNTRAVRRSADSIAVELHSTDVLTFYRDGRVMFDTDGWHTVTTKARINEYCPQGWRVWSVRGHWYLHQYAFHDGMTLTKNQTLRRADKRTSARLHAKWEDDRKATACEASAYRRHVKRCVAIHTALYPLGDKWRAAAAEIGEALLLIGEPFRRREQCRIGLRS